MGRRVSAGRAGRRRRAPRTRRAGAKGRGLRPRTVLDLAAEVDVGADDLRELVGEVVLAAAVVRLDARADVRRRDRHDREHHPVRAGKLGVEPEGLDVLVGDGPENLVDALRGEDLGGLERAGLSARAEAGAAEGVGVPALNDNGRACGSSPACAPRAPGGGRRGRRAPCTLRRSSRPRLGRTAAAAASRGTASCPCRRRRRPEGATWGS